MALGVSHGDTGPVDDYDLDGTFGPFRGAGAVDAAESYATDVSTVPSYYVALQTYPRIALRRLWDLIEPAQQNSS